MTDKLSLITERQRNDFIAAFSTLIFTTNTEPSTDRLVGKLQNHAEIKKQLNMLQSLPMVDGEPVARILHSKAPSSCGTVAKTFKEVPKDKWSSHWTEGTLLYTSPQALTPITADDVTDEMVTTYHKAHNYDYRKDIIVNAVNAWIKHRGEA